MKKILVYTFVAVLLGVVTMLAPFALFVSEMGIGDMNTQAEPSYPPTPEYMQKTPSKTEQTYGITPATHSTDTMFLVFLPVFSFVVALGVASYFKRKNV